MLSKKYRLPVQTTLSLKPRRVRRGRYFFLREFKASQPFSRVAFVVSTKVLPKAHDRNALKRRLYGACATILSELPVGDYSFLVAKDGASLADKSESDIVSELKKSIYE